MSIAFLIVLIGCTNKPSEADVKIAMKDCFYPSEIEIKNLNFEATKPDNNVLKESIVSIKAEIIILSDYNADLLLDGPKAFKKGEIYDWDFSSMVFTKLKGRWTFNKLSCPLNQLKKIN